MVFFWGAGLAKVGRKGLDAVMVWVYVAWRNGILRRLVDCKIWVIKQN